MIKLKVFLFPVYVSLEFVPATSPVLHAFLESQNIKLEGARWEGTVESLPTEPSLVRASTQMTCSWEELSDAAREAGHFVFHDDQVLLPDGTLSPSDLIREADRFLRPFI